MKIVFIYVVEMHYHLKFSEDSTSVTRAREGTWKQKILGFLKFLKINCSVTPAPVPATTISNLVLIYQVHLPASKLSQEEVVIVKICIFQGWCTPKDYFLLKNNPIVRHRFSSTFQMFLV